jgi:hypothetical protein
MVSTVTEVAHGDAAMACHLWVLVFPIVWATLSEKKEQQIALAKPIIALLSKEYHLKQAQSRPNIVQARPPTHHALCMLCTCLVIVQVKCGVTFAAPAAWSHACQGSGMLSTRHPCLQSLTSVIACVRQHACKRVVARLQGSRRLYTCMHACAQALLEGISLSQPQPKIPSELILFLGKTYNAWHIAIPLLESHVMLFPTVRTPLPPSSLRCVSPACSCNPSHA